MLLAALLLAPLVHAQGETDARSESNRERKLYLSVEKKALWIPYDIGRVDFSYPTSSPKAKGSGAVQIESVRFFAKERKLGPTVKGRRVERSAMTARQRKKYFQLRSRGLQSLWVRYRPEFIRRALRPPFDTLAVSPRTGQVVDFRDKVLHYVVYLRDGSRRSSFVEEANELPGVIGAHLPPVFK